MNKLLILSFLLLAPSVLFAADLPATVKEASQLELDGRLNEALDRYRAALSNEPVLVQDEALTQPLTILVLSKIGHLSADLGYGEEAWDAGTRLLSAKNRPAAEAGSLIRMRLRRLEGRRTDAQKVFDDYTKAWPQQPAGQGLLGEEQRVASGAESKKSASVEARLAKNGGPASWVVSGDWERLLGPTETLGLSIQETARLQVGAFKDWNHALTLITMLREQGWVPFTEVKFSGGQRLHVVYLVSRQPQIDRKRLQAQGLNPAP